MSTRSSISYRDFGWFKWHYYVEIMDGGRDLELYVSIWRIDVTAIFRIKKATLGYSD